MKCKHPLNIYKAYAKVIEEKIILKNKNKNKQVMANNTGLIGAFFFFFKFSCGVGGEVLLICRLKQEPESGG